jgi:hypothetical protein
LNSEKGYYERAEFWAADRFQQEFEHARLSMCVAAIPQSAGTLLDVGSGNGVFLGMVENVLGDIRCEGVERSVVAIGHAVCASPIVPGEITSLPYGARAFEVVSALDVIEHIPHDAYGRALSELSRVAGKYILLNVPYKENRLLATCTYCGCRFNPHYHMRSFSEESLSGLFPEFEMLGSWHVLRPVSIVEAALNPVRRSVFGGFPSYCVCPQCGYTPQASAETSQQQETVSGKMRHLVKGVIRSLPKVKIPAEIIVLYQRRDAR